VKRKILQTAPSGTKFHPRHIPYVTEIVPPYTKQLCQSHKTNAFPADERNRIKSQYGQYSARVRSKMGFITAWGL